MKFRTEGRHPLKNIFNAVALLKSLTLREHEHPKSYSVKNAPGPSGKPVTYQIIIKPSHESRNAIEYGNIIETNVPRPESSSYFFIKTTIIAK